MNEQPSFQTDALIAEDIDAYLHKHQHKSLLRFITCGSVDDGKSTDCVEKPAPETGAGAILIVVRRLVPRLCGGCGGWHGYQLGHFAEVLGGGGEEELVSCSVWTSQAQAIHPEDALEVREQHLDLLSLAARDQIGVGCGDIAGEITGALVH